MVILHGAAPPLITDRSYVESCRARTVRFPIKVTRRSSGSQAATSAGLVGVGDGALGSALLLGDGAGLVGGFGVADPDGVELGVALGFGSGVELGSGPVEGVGLSAGGTALVGSGRVSVWTARMTIRASATTVPITSARRIQYVRAGSGPTGRSTPLMSSSVGITVPGWGEARRTGVRVCLRWAQERLVR
ncbi:hypothetical protein GCM10028864_12470 [Microlunatus parietis]